MKSELLPSNNISGVIYSNLETQKIIDEQFIDDHGLCLIISGELKVSDAGIRKVFCAGELLFFRKNFLAKFIKQPEESRNYRSITIIFDRGTLLEFSKQYHAVYDQPYRADDAVLGLPYNLLLKNFFNALVPYFSSALPDQLINLKKQEALLLLLQINPALKNILFDFNQPGKIDLEAFMYKNYKFNVNLKKLAFLTGRSLATFKRDFQKIFHSPPSRWIQQKRLEEAHYLMKEENMRPTDVYHEVGFESMSHFSYSFKQFFGFNPSGIQSINKQ